MRSKKVFFIILLLSFTSGGAFTFILTKLLSSSFPLVSIHGGSQISKYSNNSPNQEGGYNTAKRECDYSNIEVLKTGSQSPQDSKESPSTPSESTESNEPYQPYIVGTEKGIKSVVFVQAYYDSKVITQKRERQPFDDIFEKFFNKKFPDVEKYRTRPQVGAGSGAIMTPDGHIITNYHVIRDADRVEITYNEEKYKAVVLSSNENTDLALLKIDTKMKLPYLKFADSDKLKYGEMVIALGNPFGLEKSISGGVISATGRSRYKLNPSNSMAELGSFIQTDASINMGNSGGPLVNLKGELVGINTAKVALHAGVGFAIPSNTVRVFLEHSLKYGFLIRGILNIKGINVDTAKDMIQLDQFPKEFNKSKIKNALKDIKSRKGFLIFEVIKKKTADKAGLKSYDIIVGINDRVIQKQSDIEDYLLNFNPGDTVKVHYLRKGKKYSTDLILETDMKYRVITLKDGSDVTTDIEGAKFINIDKEVLKKLSLDHGVRAFEISKGKWKDVGFEKGTIITSITGLDSDSKQYQIEDIKTLCIALNELIGSRIVVEGYNTRLKKKEMYPLYW